jgi:hypothetical protein
MLPLELSATEHRSGIPITALAFATFAWMDDDSINPVGKPQKAMVAGNR